MARSALFLFAGALAVSLGCSSAKKSVVILEIDSNFQVPGEIDKIVVTAMVAGRVIHELPFALGQKGQLPLRVGLLAPDGNPEGEITIVATGWKGADSLTHEDAVVSFWKDRSRVIKLFLAKECLGFLACSVGQTCTLGPHASGSAATRTTLVLVTARSRTCLPTLTCPPTWMSLPARTCPPARRATAAAWMRVTVRRPRIRV